MGGEDEWFGWRDGSSRIGDRFFTTCIGFLWKVQVGKVRVSVSWDGGRIDGRGSSWMPNWNPIIFMGKNLCTYFLLLKGSLEAYIQMFIFENMWVRNSCKFCKQTSHNLEEWKSPAY